MTGYLKTVGRVLAVMTATLGWLVVVPFVDLLSRRNDRLDDEHAPNSIARLPRAKAA